MLLTDDGLNPIIQQGDGSSRQFMVVQPGDPMTGVTFEGLEPYEWKLSCTVLKGEGGRKAPDLPGCKIGYGL